MKAYRSHLSTARTLTSILRAQAVVGNDRDIYNFIDVNRDALERHDAARGSLLRRKWL